ncbi:MAG: hypothetical protein KJ072_18180 [Verrucomicrobia bacterium]|nr:hypothetical protein [Verrucomicrobiota bacterium]
MLHGCRCLVGVAGACTVVLGGEPLAMVGQPAASYEGLTLLLDPSDHTRMALLLDPTDRLPPERRSQTLHGMQVESVSAELPVFRVTDALPEFWAEPAIWQHFRVGPAAFSGMGRGLPTKDWGGRPFTDRRAYALDSGLPARRTAAALSPSGVGMLELSAGRASLSLAWDGVAGRIYGLEYSEDLNQSFRNLRTWIAPADGRLHLELPVAAAAGFYRLVELPP